ncbi:hypothetical protein [Chthonobacter albigriseus]|uniref:hypothetical protein n=1 Tax=Chthonobacter albigriseus TaxID=1683161 RepID=UPI0015EFA440|nr:hypothetical protein [Chthonobacter albigriseus]
MFKQVRTSLACGFVAAGVLFISGCQTAERFDQEFFAQWATEWTGRPISDYIASRGIEPTTSYETQPGRRVFVFERDGFIPAVAANGKDVRLEPVVCRRVIETAYQPAQTMPSSDYADYRISGVGTGDMAC